MQAARLLLLPLRLLLQAAAEAEKARVAVQAVPALVLARSVIQVVPAGFNLVIMQPTPAAVVVLRAIPATAATAAALPTTAQEPTALAGVGLEALVPQPTMAAVEALAFLVKALVVLQPALVVLEGQTARSLVLPHHQDLLVGRTAAVVAENTALLQTPARVSAALAQSVSFGPATLDSSHQLVQVIFNQEQI